MNTDQIPYPPAAAGLPAGTLEAAEIGANRLDAWARTPQGRNFLAHALVQLARAGWLRTEPGDGFEPARGQQPAAPVSPLADDPDELSLLTVQPDERDCDTAPTAPAQPAPPTGQTAEQDVTRVTDLYERWVKAGPPPLGTPMSRWWDSRLVELHDAIRPHDQPKEQ